MVCVCVSSNLKTGAGERGARSVEQGRGKTRERTLKTGKNAPKGNKKMPPGAWHERRFGDVRGVEAQQKREQEPKKIKPVKKSPNASYGAHHTAWFSLSSCFHPYGLPFRFSRWPSVPPEAQHARRRLQLLQHLDARAAAVAGRGKGVPHHRRRRPRAVAAEEGEAVSALVVVVVVKKKKTRARLREAREGRRTTKDRRRRDCLVAFVFVTRVMDDDEVPGFDAG